MLELMESSGGGGKGGRVPARVSGSSTPPSRGSPSHSREGSPLLLKRALHPPLAGQLSAPPVQQYHERLHASLKRSNSLKRLLKLPIFGGQTGECVGAARRARRDLYSPIGPSLPSAVHVPVLPAISASVAHEPVVDANSPPRDTGSL
ncbi:uncharacterized protein LOC126982798 [Eriocheir sinensis]|uniref:uncharacterized protein LOC126982798 n=1 Tax=Eriocheir sinensis TaxID=95602 RepID=UPI0021C68850|nr:uncharacterized protein LOC126982798 [Eriocheir sinensis]